MIKEQTTEIKKSTDDKQSVRKGKFKGRVQVYISEKMVYIRQSKNLGF